MTADNRLPVSAMSYVLSAKKVSKVNLIWRTMPCLCIL